LVLDYEPSDPAWNAVISGGAVAALALVRATSPRRVSALNWMHAVIGLVVMSSVLYEASARADWNQALSGVAIFCLAIWSGAATGRSRAARALSPR
jgi:hypothetical protein